MPVAASPAPEEEELLLGELAAGNTRRREDARKRHGRGALDVVVEGRAGRDTCCSSRKALWLAKSSNWITRPERPRCAAADEFVDQRVVCPRRADATLAQAEVERVVEQRLVVGADVEHHRQAGTGWMPAQAV